MKAARTFIYYLSTAIFWVPLIGFALLLSHNAILYFTHGGDYGILPEKLLARQDWLWNFSFYIHLPFGIICLLIPIVSFLGRFFKVPRAIHRVIGNVYVFTTLYIVCPTGIYLALYAKGGLITQVGFVIQGLLLFLFTWQGYKRIGEGRSQEHISAMIRSYAVATVVLTFRILHIIFFLLKVPYQDNYAISQWLGLFLNLLIAELIIEVASRKRSSTKIKSKYYETA